jgi:Inner membrane protein YgaP-like, transmembrane domain
MKENVMTVERAVRAMAGVVILLSMALAHYVSPYWYFLTAFVGLNLLQSAFTNWCPAMTIFRMLGLKDAGQTSGVVKNVPAGAAQR